MRLPTLLAAACAIAAAIPALAQTPADQPAPATANSANSARGCATPVYPLSAQRKGQEGTVIMRFLVGADGRVLASQIERSSGVEELDTAARESITRCNKFKPGMKDGQPVESWARVAYEWRLTDAPRNNLSQAPWYAGPDAKIEELATDELVPKAKLLRMQNWTYYPQRAKTLKQEGTTVVKLRIAADGRVMDAHIVESSGSPDLDRASRNTLGSSATFAPATVDGVPVESWLTLAYRWKLPQQPPATP